MMPKCLLKRLKWNSGGNQTAGANIPRSSGRIRLADSGSSVVLHINRAEIALQDRGNSGDSYVVEGGRWLNGEERR